MGNTGPESDVPSAASGGGEAGLRPAGAGARLGRWSRALEALDRILNRGGDSDEVLRAAVRLLAEEPGIEWAAIAFREDGAFVVGPQSGEPDDSRRIRVPVVYRGSRVGELWIDGDAEQAFLERFAVLVSAHVLTGWDTLGDAWDA